ncbi:hypothetical protein I302_102944 [Kwoniella bestiolae CBS 10118]|uniref:Uncharacterized protein n=1 Tax=Kwoniella bestiolae CBS 10118 TaxID=1296100 RepID=A0A1B9GGP4_9TREE|nr:hypothetical protein I302_01640 [Kwoniella bestiolae CBS 10118]OCF30121.1 hypothetical protein I302_01640 [Kwoniella bestiolae CBS 10118]
MDDTLVGYGEGLSLLLEVRDAIGLPPASPVIPNEEPDSTSEQMSGLDSQDYTLLGDSRLTYSMASRQSDELSNTVTSPGSQFTIDTSPQETPTSTPAATTITSPLSHDWAIRPKRTLKSADERKPPKRSIDINDGLPPPVGSGCENCLSKSSPDDPRVCRLSVEDQKKFEARYREYSEGRTDNWLKWSKEHNWGRRMPTCLRCRRNGHRCNFPEIPRSIVSTQGRR